MTRKIIGIWAQDQQGLIGKKHRLPWSLPADLQHFKETTIGHILVMGRVTFEGMGKRALPDRTSIILTRNREYQVAHKQVLVCHSVEEILEWYQEQEQQLFVIGGSQVFRLFEPYLEELKCTDIQANFEGDAYFPSDFNWSNWREVESVYRSKDEANSADFMIRTFVRKEK